MRTTIKLFAALPMTVTILILAGCASCAGSASASSRSATAAAAGSYDCASPDGANPAAATIAAQPIFSNGALYAGVDEGIFEKHGITLEIQPVANVAASIASVQGGASDFGFATTVNIFQSLDSEVHVKMIAPFAGIAPGYYEKMQAGEEGYTTEVTGLVVSPDSGIKSPADLEGRRSPWSMRAGTQSSSRDT